MQFLPDQRYIKFNKNKMSLIAKVNFIISKTEDLLCRIIFLVTWILRIKCLYNLHDIDEEYIYAISHTNMFMHTSTSLIKKQ